MIGGLMWYAGFRTVLSVLSKINPVYLCFSFLAYFLINVLFTVRIIRVLRRQGVKAGFVRTLLAQYAGMLTSDVTPGRSGYLLTTIYLQSQEIETSASLSCIVGIQAIEFLVKVIGGALALVFLLSQTGVSRELFWVGSLGIGLMLLGGFVLAAMIWSPTATALIKRIAASRFLARFTGRIMGKMEEFGANAMKTRSIIPEITFIAILCWILKGFEWYFLGLSIGITTIPWVGFFLMHPLITAFSFVPLTPSGIGFQEGAIVGIFLLLGVDVRLAVAFAILARGLVIMEDLIGVPQIVKSAESATTKLVQGRGMRERDATIETTNR
jgi:uncharacterized protein (TIRG00374 family)